MRGRTAPPRTGLAAVGASALLHAAAIAGLLMAASGPEPAAPPESGVALVWERQEEGAGDAVDSTSLAVPALPEPAMPPPPAMPAEVPPLPGIDPPPPAPERIPAAPNPAAAPPPAPAVAELPPPPIPPAPGPPDPAPVAEELPPPPPPAPPRQVARAVPPRPAGGAPPSPAPAAGPEPPPQAIGGALALGAVTPPRPREGANNPSPEYPRASRLRGEEGRVRMVARVNPEGRVVHVAVVGSSGFPALDEEAERTVRRWRFEPARRDGIPVFSSLPIGITFQLEGGRRW